jgi:3-hydroxyacyl-CoA dehydrogenase/3a,7a,12a-trihydroxy-5b-cholest-24-enoyl-CoA hydratase
MANELRFDGRVAVITGAGGGLGRAHALLLASRGAAVVVNDLGSSVDGAGKGSAAADAVVDEIKKTGGEATANYDSVENGEAIIQTALDAYKRVDIVINNAGILRDVSFHKMTDADWDLIYRVHVLGSYKVTHAAWPHLREQQFGRVIMTASAAGLYGNFGQANYSMAKLGLLGFAKSLAIEGQTKGILTNTIAPVAGSRMTETVMPKELVDALKPEYVSPLVAWLCHDDCTENGAVFEVGAGWHGKLRWQRVEGWSQPLSRGLTVEDVQKNFDKIGDFSDPTYPTSAMESAMGIGANLKTLEAAAGNENIDPEKVLAFTFPKNAITYNERDVSLYALGIGAARDATDPAELQYVYEMNSSGHKAFPTYAVTLPFGALFELTRAEGLKFNPMMLLHGEQFLELKKPLPTSATVTTEGRVKNLWDKGKGAVIVTEFITKDESGDVLCVNENTVFIRGLGDFGGERGPSGEVNVPPDRKPDAVVEELIDPNQALIYRLSGDRNPLHADPSMAAMGGFDKPILHGLCTLGFATRHVLKNFAGNDSSRFKSIKVRFAKHVFPGETLITEMWKESDNRILFRCIAKERNEPVITNAAIELGQTSGATAQSSGNGSAKASVNPEVDVIFAEMSKRIASKTDIVSKVGAVFQFDVKDVGTWTVDLKNGNGSVDTGAADQADCTIAVGKDDFVGLMTGKLDGQQLFMAGKLKVSGNMMLATKLSLLQ